MHMSKTFLVVGAVSLGMLASSAIAATPSEDDKLREALHQKMSEMENTTPPAATGAATTATAAPNPLVTPAGQEDPEAAKMREALQQRMSQEAVTAAAVAETKATAPQAVNPEYVPLTAPALPISASKEQRLQQLLQQYKADQITPEEYHAQRAKIIAE